ncbi:3206_t:CDS:2, partial [Ambispora gerdemannii]
METKYSREVLENQQLIKKGLPANEYLYKVSKPSERFSYIVVVPEEIYDNCGKKIPQQKGDYEIAKIKDEESQKSAKKWLKNYIKNLRDAPKKDEAIISHLWKDAIIHAERIYSGIGKRDGNIGYTTNNDYLNALDKITDSTHSKLSDLLLELSKLNVEYRNAIYKLIMQTQKCKPEITILEQYIFLYDLGSECRALMNFWNTWHKVVGLEFTRLQALP